ARAGWGADRAVDARAGAAADRGGEAAHHGVGGEVGLRFVRVAGAAHRRAELDAAGAAALLHGVGDLVGEEVVTLRRAGVVLAGGEVDVLAGGEGVGAERLRGARRRVAGVDAHA